MVQLQTQIAETTQSIANLSGKLQTLQRQADAVLDLDQTPSKRADGQDHLFLDRVLSLLQREGREEGTWEGIMDRLQQMRKEAVRAQEVAAGDAKAAGEERKWARRMGRSHPVFSAAHSNDVVTFSMASDEDEDGPPRDTAEEWGSATDREMLGTATEEGSTDGDADRDKRHSATRARSMPTEFRPQG